MYRDRPIYENEYANLLVNSELTFLPKTEPDMILVISTLLQITLAIIILSSIKFTNVSFGILFGQDSYSEQYVVNMGFKVHIWKMKTSSYCWIIMKILE